MVRMYQGGGVGMILILEGSRELRACPPPFAVSYNKRGYGSRFYNKRGYRVAFPLPISVFPKIENSSSAVSHSGILNISKVA
jgi:hypothetical protein